MYQNANEFNTIKFLQLPTVLQMNITGFKLYLCGMSFKFPAILFVHQNYLPFALII